MKLLTPLRFFVPILLLLWEVLPLQPPSFVIGIRSSLRKQRQLHHSSISPSSSKVPIQSEPAIPNLPSITNAALLIAGTTVGGGFLALPVAVAPIGFAPAAVTLFAVWAFFLAQSFVVVECLSSGQRRPISNNSSSTTHSLNVNNRSGNDINEVYAEASGCGVAAAARKAFGRKGEVAAAVLLLVIVEATLVSQLSRAGSLIAPMFRGSYRLGCAATAIASAMVVFGPRDGFKTVTTINSALNVVFLATAVWLFRSGAGMADWSRLKLRSGKWRAVPACLPTMLQLLVYAEILPTICQLLHFNLPAIRVAILTGSALPLILEVFWAGLGFGLVDATGADPVDVLLASSPVRRQLFLLTTSAIATTVIGSYLALQSIFDDLISPSASRMKTARSGRRNSVASWQRRIVCGCIVCFPALAIAAISPSVFLQAIDFAGSYPVLLLWGLAPPMAALSLRRKKKWTGRAIDSSEDASGKEVESTASYGNITIETDDGRARNYHTPSSGPLWWLITLAGASTGLLAMSAVPDAKAASAAMSNRGLNVLRALF